MEHAIECRINAEDPARGFLPSPGLITRLRVPGGPGVRWDGGYDEGGADLAVLRQPRRQGSSAWGPDLRVRRAADLDAPRSTRLQVGGVRTTVPAHQRCCSRTPISAAARHSTKWSRKRSSTH